MHTRLTISPLFTSMTNMVPCWPATRISEVALEVKLIHRRSLISSSLRQSIHQLPEAAAVAPGWACIHVMCGQTGGPLRMAMWTPREPRAMTPLSLNSIWCTAPSEGGCARKEVYFWRLFP